jgi:hypothetical protein
MTAVALPPPRRFANICWRLGPATTGRNEPQRVPLAIGAGRFHRSAGMGAGGDHLGPLLCLTMLPTCAFDEHHWGWMAKECRCSGERARSSLKTFARWRWVSPIRSPQFHESEPPR